MSEILKSCWKHKFSNLLMMLQIILVIVYFFMTMVSIQHAFNICIEVPHVLGDKYDNAVHCEVQNDGMDTTDFNKLLNTLEESKIVNHIAFYNTNTASIESEYFGNEVIANLQIELGILKIADLQVQEGRIFQQEDLQDEITPLLVGCELAAKYNVKIGDIVEDNGKKYEIVGVLKKNSCWFVQSISEGLILSLDTQVVTLASKRESQEDIQMHYYGIANSKLTAEQAAEQINDMAKDSHIVLKAAALKDELNQQFQKVWDDNIYWLAFSVIMIFMVAIGTASLAVTHLYSRKKEVGIRMALGYSPRRIFFLFAGEIVVLTLVSYGISCIIGFFMIGNGVDALGDMMIHTGYGFTGTVAALGGIGAVCMCLPSLLILTIVVRKFQPKNLMGGKE